MKAFLLLLLLVTAGFAYYYYFYRPAHSALEAGYVLPATLPLMDSPAEVHFQIAELHRGERVAVLDRTRNWTRIRTAAGITGWVDAKGLLAGETFNAGERLGREVGKVQAQAQGHLTGDSTLRLAPSRDAPELGDLSASTAVEVVGRRIVSREAKPGEVRGELSSDQESPREPARDVWYLVRRNAQAGWLIGRSVSLDIPESISAYAQDVNMVAWLVLNRVHVNGTQIPQYVVADRMDTQELDFNHVRVLTWWAKVNHYAISYVESNLNGFFPIRTGEKDGVPIFRLRLVDAEGRKYQKVYGLFDTVVRALGTVEGWESDAIPAPAKEVRRRIGPRTRASAEECPGFGAQNWARASRAYTWQG